MAAGRELFGLGAGPHRLAAAYGRGLAEGRPFARGNLPLALAVIYVILRTGGFRLCAGEAECVDILRDVAAGRTGEEVLAFWLEQNAKPA